MHWNRTPLLTLGLVAFAAGCAGPVQQARPYPLPRAPANTFLSRGRACCGRVMVADSLPPARLFEIVPPQPYEDAVWIAGDWDWDGVSWIWIPGHWEVAPLGYAWIGPTYDLYGGYCEYTQGSWQRRPRTTKKPTEIPARDARGQAQPRPPAFRVPRDAPTYTVAQPVPDVQPAPAQTPPAVHEKPSRTASSYRSHAASRELEVQQVPQRFWVRPELRRSQPPAVLSPTLRASQPALVPASPPPRSHRAFTPSLAPAPASRAFTPLPAARSDRVAPRAFQSFSPPPSKPVVQQQQQQQYTPPPAAVKAAPAKADKPILRK